MARVRIDHFASLDGYASTTDQGSDNPMGEDWGRLTAAYAATRTFRERVFGDTSGAGTTGIDDSYAAAHFAGVGAEIMGAAMFGLSRDRRVAWRSRADINEPARCSPSGSGRVTLDRGVAEALAHPVQAPALRSARSRTAYR